MAAKKERPAPTRKTPAASAKPAAKRAASQPFEARAEISAEELRKLIAEAAYYRAKERGFAPGYEVDDWVQAEAEVKRLIGRTA
jgi:pyruvate/2-oxoglutarate dehydrogenase complex dihydrolipoamide acyltransferase (E2) component